MPTASLRYVFVFEATFTWQASPPIYMSDRAKPLVGIIMGSKSDWETLRHARDLLTQFEVPHECRIVSAHRTPIWLAEYASKAEARGIEVIIAGAGGAAHLPGMAAAQTLLPVLGVPVESHALKGMDSLLSIVQMPVWHPGGHSGHRQARGDQRGPPRSGHPLDLASGITREAPAVSDGTNRSNPA